MKMSSDLIKVVDLIVFVDHRKVFDEVDSSESGMMITYSPLVTRINVHLFMSSFVAMATQGKHQSNQKAHSALCERSRVKLRKIMTSQS